MRLQSKAKKMDDRLLAQLGSLRDLDQKKALQVLRKKFYEHFIGRVSIFSLYKEKTSPTIIGLFDQSFYNFETQVSEVLERSKKSENTTLKSIFERYYFDVVILAALRGVDLKQVEACEKYLVNRYEGFYEVSTFRDSMRAQGLEENFKDVFIKSFLTFLKKIHLPVEEGGFASGSTLKQFFLGIFKNQQLTFFKTKESKIRQRDINRPATENEAIKILLSSYADPVTEEREALLEDDFVDLVASFTGDQITKVFSELSERCQQLIYFRILEEMKHQEIAKKMDISETNARVQFNKCLKDLQSKFSLKKNKT